MNIEETYIRIVTGQLTLSAAMAIAQIECHLSEEEKEWISKELSGYDGKQAVPDYRQLTCEVNARVQNLYTGTIQDIRMVGAPMESLDTMLKTNFGTIVLTGGFYAIDCLDVRAGGNVVSSVGVKPVIAGAGVSI